MAESNSTAGLSSLVYDTRFSYSYLRPKYWGVWFGILLLFLISLLPRLLQDRLANVLGDFFRKVNAKRQRIARINIELCFPELSKAEQKDFLVRYYRHHVRSLLAFGLIWWGSKPSWKKRLLYKGRRILKIP